MILKQPWAFDDAVVTGWDALEGSYGLPDPDDEHVVAAAVVGRAGAIVTHNTRDYPLARIPPGIEILSPRQFTANTVGLSPTRALAAILAIVSRSGHRGPVRTVSGVLDTLEERYGMDQAVELLRPLVW